MRLFSQKFVCAFLSFFIFFVFQFDSNASDREGLNEHLRVLVDTSKDGGTWWFPQGPPSFDPNMPHQGKDAADSMRRRGWEVVELPRGVVITPDILNSFDIVIRPTAFGRYMESEVVAYKEAVSAGTRLLLMGSAGSDAIAEGFGLHFSDHSQIASVKKVIPLSLTAEKPEIETASGDDIGMQNSPVIRVFSIWTNDIPWVPVTEMPPGAEAIAWISDQNYGESPVLGYYRYNEGYVLFIGSALGIYNQGREWRDKLLTFLEHNSPSDLQPLSSATPISIESTGPLPPALISPSDGDILPQPSAGLWTFEWENIPGAESYQLIVLGSGAAIPLIDIVTRSSEYTVLPQPGSYITENNRYDWTWRVRVQGLYGQWGDWSEIHHFDVEPLR